MPHTPSTTIDQSLKAFLVDQRQCLSARTMRTYEDVIGLLRDCLNGYGPNALDEPDRKRWEEAYQDDEEALCHLLGPERILPEVDEFLGSFMVRKVTAGQDLLRSAGTVTKKLAAWLHVPRQASDLARPGWDVTATLIRQRGTLEGSRSRQRVPTLTASPCTPVPLVISLSPAGR